MTWPPPPASTRVIIFGPRVLFVICSCCSHCPQVLLPSSPPAPVFTLSSFSVVLFALCSLRFPLLCNSRLLRVPPRVSSAPSISTITWFSVHVEVSAFRPRRSPGPSVVCARLAFGLRRNLPTLFGLFSSPPVRSVLYRPLHWASPLLANAYIFWTAFFISRKSNVKYFTTFKYNQKTLDI